MSNKGTSTQGMAYLVIQVLGGVMQLSNGKV